MTDTQTVSLTTDGAIATITIDRPEVHNAFNEDVIAGLASAFKEASDNDNIRVVILRSQGRSFSAGADLDWMRRAAEFTEAEGKSDALRLASMLWYVAECRHPVIARVQGAALGGGAGLVAASDIAVASDAATFGFTEVRLGLIPATIAPHVIEKIGVGRALPLFLTGERIDAATAASIGLVHRVVPADRLDAEVDAVVATLLQGSATAQSECKKLVRTVAAMDRQEIDEITSGLIAAIRTGDEGREGVWAFLEKRKPAWAAEAADV